MKQSVSATHYQRKLLILRWQSMEVGIWTKSTTRYLNDKDENNKSTPKTNSSRVTFRTENQISPAFPSHYVNQPI